MMSENLSLLQGQIKANQPVPSEGALRIDKKSCEWFFGRPFIAGMIQFSKVGGWGTAHAARAFLRDKTLEMQSPGLEERHRSVLARRVQRRTRATSK